MKLGIIAGLLTACLLKVGGPILGQHQGSTTLLRIYEDDDYFNIRGKGTDQAYTNGSRIDLFYIHDRPSHLVVDEILPRAGENSIDVYGWSIMEVMYTPKQIADTAFQPNDYPWSGSLFVSHSRRSYNPVRHYLLQTEVIAGIIGPASLAGPIQAGFHRMIHYQQPKGWQHQFRNDLLLNLNINLEKQLLTLPSRTEGHPWLEFIGGTQLSGGIMDNQASLYTLLRIGRMTPYFKGLFSQYGSQNHTLQNPISPSNQNNKSSEPRSQKSHKGQCQLYFTARPQITAVVSNAILQGGVFSKKPDEDTYTSKTGKTYDPYHPLNGLVCNIDYGAVLAFRSFAISYTQDWSSALMKTLYSHEFGNFSLYFTL